MDKVQRPVSPADYDPERHFDERGVDPNPALDDKPRKRTGPEGVERPVEPTTAYGYGAAMVTEPRVAATEGIEESPTWAGQEKDRPSNQSADDEQQDNAQTNATRGYATSDKHIFDLMNERLAQHEHLDPTDITVYVARGVVTLTGTVDEHAEKEAAEALAREIEGVQDVRNMLYVDDGSDQPGTLPASGPHIHGHGNGHQANDMPDDVGRMQAHTGQSDHHASRTDDVHISDMSPAIPETTPVTAFTDEAGHTTGLKVTEGMEVVGLDGKSVGHIKAVRVSDFLVSRTLARDVYAPFECVQAIEGNRVTLMVNAGEVGDQGWANP